MIGTDAYIRFFMHEIVRLFNKIQLQRQIDEYTEEHVNDNDKEDKTVNKNNLFRNREKDKIKEKT